jgi:hypothetical protein
LEKHFSVHFLNLRFRELFRELLELLLEGYVNVVHIGVEGVQHFVTTASYVVVSFTVDSTNRTVFLLFLLALR